MELKTYLAILSRRKWTILIAAIVSVFVATIGTLLITPQYVASATLRVATITGVVGEVVRPSDILYTDRLMNTYHKISTSQPVLEELTQRLGRVNVPSVSVSIVANTELMQISVEDSDPVVAAKAANTMADILIAKGKEFYTGDGKAAQIILAEQVTQMQEDIRQARSDFENLAVQPSNDSERLAAARRKLELREATYGRLLEQYDRTRANEAARENAISLVEPAAIPAGPSNPNLPLSVGLALLVGLVGGIGMAFLFENLDTTLYTPEKIEEVTQLSILGQIPAAKHQASSSFFDSYSPQGEAFRRLRTTLFALDDGVPIKTLLVTSAEPNEGKSTIVANLAFVIAQTGHRVMVVDGDMRKPTIHQIFDMPNNEGLSTILEHKARLAEAVQNSNIPGVHVLTSGPRPSNPAELLSSPQMRDILRQLANEFDIVLLDTPALLAATDAGVLAAAADGVIQVVGCAQSQEQAVRSARQQLTTFKAKLIGVIVNRTAPTNLYYYYHQRASELVAATPHNGVEADLREVRRRPQQLSRRARAALGRAYRGQAGRDSTSSGTLIGQEGGARDDP